MKNIIYSLGFMILCHASFSQDKKVALVTFYTDKYFNADKIVESARNATYELTKKDDPRFDLRPILEGFYETFNDEYVKKFPFSLASEKDVLQHPNYKAYTGLEGIEDKDSIDSMSETMKDRFIAIDGYNVLLTGGNLLRSWRTEAHMLENLSDLDIDGVMFVSLYYQWEPKVAIGGMGNAGIRAYVLVELFNQEAKKIFKLEEFATSKKSVALIDGAPVMNYDKLLPMCEDATDRLVDDLNKNLPKLVKKIDKEL